MCIAVVHVQHSRFNALLKIFLVTHCAYSVCLHLTFIALPLSLLLPRAFSVRLHHHHLH